MNKIIKAGFLLTMAFSVCRVSFAQNNAIFFGGSGDGFGSGSYAQLFESAGMFQGGNGDGFASSSYEQANAGAAKYLGGNGDGYAFDSYAQAFDGASKYLGGNGDGYASNNYEQAYAELRKGGVGDGWASNVLALSPLPLTLLSFTGKDLAGAHLLEWKTAQEKNLGYFELEHTANTATSYSALGRIAAAGNSNQPLDYRYSNNQPNMGDNFYRLKMVDKDGKFSYSNVVLLKVLSNKATLLLYPNPTASMLNVELGGASDGSLISIDLYDMTGKKLEQQDLKNDKKIISLNVSRYPAGNYILRIINNGVTEVVKFSKVN